ncbi:Oxygen-independent coproporphyrinogen-III oxidase-like protein YqeR [termite gut metagenome]|uniref:Oxygen-independent coproporphyrinogen-III oxidase-like protein YqeR n=1 Tax=termite gut metagenome TaxID=433724 RepID=A0A5J4SSY3_9ZZZZ
MVGIYIHIPFCKTRCIYCDFCSTTRMELKRRYVDALCRELETRKPYLQGESVKTIYFGGGTPSLLNAEDFNKIFNALSCIYGMGACKEITLEANPDDLNTEYVQLLSSFPFNRISIGIQTFNDTLLNLLNRRHSAVQALAAVDNCRRVGFDNISIDLMYGLPGETLKDLICDLSHAVSLHVEHISAYHLTYEKGTPIYSMLQKHRIEEVDEENSLRFFAVLTDRLSEAGYEQYEISNFCRPGKHSLHNTAYWEGTAYMGCGLSAHSYNGHSREWNTSSLDDYIKNMEDDRRVYETEELDLITRYNELIVTSVRTCRGLSLKQLEADFGKEYLVYCLNMAQKYLNSGNLELSGDYLRLTHEGIFVSDGIMSDLFRI